MSERPTCAVIAGPNGAGKSTAAPVLLRDTLGLVEYVNADVVARGLSGFDPASANLEAGRVVLARLRALAAARSSFAYETTLASRTFAPWLRGLIAGGYHVHLSFLWLPTADLAVERVDARARLGGHRIPEETVRRRYVRGLANFFDLYQPPATTWRFYDSSAPELRIVATGEGTIDRDVRDPETWAELRRKHAADEPPA